jgi:hypothetical protein
VPDRGRRDEIGRIADAVEALRGTVADAFAAARCSSRCRSASCSPTRTGRVPHHLRQRRVAASCCARIEDQMPVKAEALIGQSIDIFHTRGGRRLRGRRQANADVQSVAAAAEEMAASVEEITRRVAEAAEVAAAPSPRRARPTTPSAAWPEAARASATWCA